MNVFIYKNIYWEGTGACEWDLLTNPQAWSINEITKILKRLNDPTARPPICCAVMYERYSFWNFNYLY